MSATPDLRPALAVETTERDAVLRCESVHFSYPGGVEANRGIDLTLYQVELFCLLGPNGAGKATLIRQR